MDSEKQRNEHSGSSDCSSARPYPVGQTHEARLAWDEAWKQRQRADYFEDAIQSERDLSKKRAHAEHLWSVARSALIDAGCPLDGNCYVPTTIEDWLHRTLGDNYGRREL